MCDHQGLGSACAYTQSDQSLCWSLEYYMIVKLLTEHHLEFLSLKGGCRGSSVSTHVKMPHSWKSHATAHMSFFICFYHVFISFVIGLAVIFDFCIFCSWLWSTTNLVRLTHLGWMETIKAIWSSNWCSSTHWYNAVRNIENGSKFWNKGLY